jgi:hypothetical protein
MIRQAKHILLSLALLVAVMALRVTPAAHAARPANLCPTCHYPFIAATANASTGWIEVTGSGFTYGNFVKIVVTDAYSGQVIGGTATLPYPGGRIDAFAGPFQCVVGVQAYDNGSHAWSNYVVVYIPYCVM